MNTDLIDHQPTDEELDALELELDDADLDELDATIDQHDANQRQKREDQLDEKHRAELEIALLERELNHARFLQTRIIASQECRNCGFARRYHKGRRCEGSNVYKATKCPRFEPYGIN